jgi:hypothetical protein
VILKCKYNGLDTEPPALSWFKSMAMARIVGRDQPDPLKCDSDTQWPLRESNPNAFRHKILSLACLPISPSGLKLSSK